MDAILTKLLNESTSHFGVALKNNKPHFDCKSVLSGSKGRAGRPICVRALFRR